MDENTRLRAESRRRMREAVERLKEIDRMSAAAQAQKRRVVYRMLETERERVAIVAPGELDVDSRARQELTASLVAKLLLEPEEVAQLILESEVLVCDLPATLGALDDGVINLEHAQAIVHYALQGEPVRRAAFEEEALVAARTLDVDEFDLVAAGLMGGYL